MPFDLTTAVNQAIRPLVELRGGRLVRTIGSKWGDQLVDFILGDLRIRVEVERGYADLLFASVNDPGQWFRAEHVVAFLGGCYRVDASSYELAVEQFEELLSKYSLAVQERFGAAHYAATKQDVLDFLRQWKASAT